MFITLKPFLFSIIWHSDLRFGLFSNIAPSNDENRILKGSAYPPCLRHTRQLVCLCRIFFFVVFFLHLKLGVGSGWVTVLKRVRENWTFKFSSNISSVTTWIGKHEILSYAWRIAASTSPTRALSVCSYRNEWKENTDIALGFQYCRCQFSFPLCKRVQENVKANILVGKHNLRKYPVFYIRLYPCTKGAICTLTPALHMGQKLDISGTNIKNTIFWLKVS